MRLVRADTAFQDEATYLWAGHLEWAHWLHGAPIPPFPTYFSGAPVIYPPLGALADSAGGLAGARVLSLVFMLGATVALWDAAGRLYGRRAAFFAAALFAVSGPALHLGAFATYDALSVLLVALAAWCVIRAGDRGEGTGWMVAAGAALAVANAAAYSSALFDLVVLALALLTACPAGRRLAARRCATLLIVVVVLVTAGLLIGGSDYLTGVEQTTLARVGGADSPAHGARRRLVLDRPDRAPGRRRRDHQLGRAAGTGADLAAGGPGRRRGAGAAGTGAVAHPGLAEQARGPGRLVRRHRRRLCGRPVHRRRPGRAAPRR